MSGMMDVVGNEQSIALRRDEFPLMITSAGPSVWSGETVHVENQEMNFERVEKEAVEYRGDQVTLDPSLMRASVPYPYPFAGGYMVAVKRANGSVDFYVLEASEDGA